MLKQLEALSIHEKTGNTQLAALRKEISDIKQQIHLLTTLNLQGTLDTAYFTMRSQELDKKLVTAHKQLHASVEDKDCERLDELRRLIGMLEKSEPITKFNEIIFEQTVKQITVLSQSEICFQMIGEQDETEDISLSINM